jgi:serine/threonine-protein kinase
MTEPDRRLSDALADRYTIERKLGEGGMATVFLARDVKHNRPVALKVLKPELAAVVGADRFLAEIETTANLQHPHILPLFDSGEADGFLFYVMPFVEGESLRDMLDRERQLPVDDAVKIATNLAEALDYAHRKGVIHRDIKPANVLLLDGKPVLADFGIALAVGAAGGGRLTETGLSVGTPHYMSPEQATGEVSVGPTTDIYALGCVLYETLVGSPPHVGGTAQAILGKIITGTPDPITQHRSTVPPQVDAAVRKALERVPADRFRTAPGFADALADPSFRSGAGGSDLAGAGESAGHSWRGVAIAGWALAAVAVALAFLLRGSSPATAARDVGLPYDAPMALLLSRNFDLSSDGRFVVYEAASEPTTLLYYRSLEDDEVRPIRGTEGAYGSPRISPDGSRVAFIAEEELRTVPLEGGVPSTLAEVTEPLGGEWTDEGLIFLSDADGQLLRWIDPETGPARELDVDYCINPFLLEGADAVLCGGGGTNAAFIRPLSDPQRDRFFRRGTAQEQGFTGVAGSDFRLIDDAYLVYMSPAGDLMAAAVLDRDSLTVGRAVTMIRGVRMEAYSGTGQYDLSDDGTLAYVLGRNAEVAPFVVIDEEGRESELNVEAAAHVRFAFSPDGRRFASVVEAVENQELRLYDLATGRAQVLDEDYYMGQPRWSPDGSRLAYTKRSDVRNEGLYVVEPNSSTEPRMLMGGPTDRPWMVVGAYLDDTTLLLASLLQHESAGLLDPTADSVRVTALGLSSVFLAVTPDQRWLAYQPQGSSGVNLQPWPARDRTFVVDPLGAEPQWRSSSEVVFYRLDDEGISFYRARATPGGTPPFDDPVLWTRDPLFADTDGLSYTFAPDGDLVYKRSPDNNRGYYLRVVPDWVSQMKRAVDEANR